MKNRRQFFLSVFLLGALAPFLTSCTAILRKQPSAPAPAITGGDGKSVTTQNDDLGDYNVVSIADPLQPLNRATFWFNDQVYKFAVRPFSKTYDWVVPKPLRTGVYNVFDNVDFPIRFVNDTLQGNFKRAEQETGKFLINTTVGVAGIMRQSDRFPSLANVPAADTGQTFAKWGIGHGIYIVLPILGPSSLRDTVGKVGDYALNPVTWLTLYVPYSWTLGVSVPDGVRVLHDKLSQYDAATSNSLDRYLAIRSSYIQNRAEKASQ